jgi:hypothetical protein
MVFHLVTDPDSAPDLSGAPADLVPLLTAMLAHRAQDRPSLVEVVQRCRSVVEAHGLKIAQARRRLTAHTARQHGSAVPPPAPAPSLTVPFEDLPTTTASATQEPATEADSVVPTPTLPAPTVVTEATEPRSPATAEPGEIPHGSHGEQPAPSRPVKPPRHGMEASRTLRHSAQARKTAQHIRAAYAVGAPFAPSRSA